MNGPVRQVLVGLLVLCALGLIFIGIMALFDAVIPGPVIGSGMIIGGVMGLLVGMMVLLRRNGKS